MIHYVNADMYDEAWKRCEEARFMNNFHDFVQSHKAVLAAISERIKLEYLVMDCAQTHTCELLLFEIDYGGVVHTMDVESIFPYKNEHSQKAQMALRALSHRLMRPCGHTAIYADPSTSSYEHT